MIHFTRVVLLALLLSAFFGSARASEWKGSLQDRTGESSFAGASITAYRIGVQDGLPVLESTCKTTVDAENYWRCAGLGPGSYLMVAQAQRRQREATTYRLAIVGLSAGQNLDPIDLRDTDVTTTTVLAREGRAVHVRTSAPPVNARSGLWLVALDCAGVYLPMGTFRLDGSEVLVLPEGRYQIERMVNGGIQTGGSWSEVRQKRSTSSR